MHINLDPWSSIIHEINEIIHGQWLESIRNHYGAF